MTFAIILLLTLSGLTFYLLAHPITKVTKTLETFALGKHTSRVKGTSRVKELHDLTHYTNKALDIIEQELLHTQQSPTQIQQRLLASEYLSILQELDRLALEQKAPRIKDLQKTLGLTHPTVKARLTYLEKRGLIKITQEGRNKIVQRIVKE